VKNGQSYLDSQRVKNGCFRWKEGKRGIRRRRDIKKEIYEEILI
jgi:hypothetical protein